MRTRRKSPAVFCLLCVGQMAFSKSFQARHKFCDSRLVANGSPVKFRRGPEGLTRMSFSYRLCAFLTSNSYRAFLSRRPFRARAVFLLVCSFMCGQFVSISAIYLNGKGKAQ